MSHFPLTHISQILTRTSSTKKFEPHAHTYHIIIVVINALLTLYYSIMSHATLNSPSSRIRVNTRNLLNITCTLVTMGVICRRGESIRVKTEENEHGFGLNFVVVSEQICTFKTGAKWRVVNLRRAASFWPLS